jgi:hypothetical protein
LGFVTSRFGFGFTNRFGLDSDLDLFLRDLFGFGFVFFLHLGLIQTYSDIFGLGFGFDASIWI